MLIPHLGFPSRLCAFIFWILFIIICLYDVMLLLFFVSIKPVLISSEWNDKYLEQNLFLCIVFKCRWGFLFSVHTLSLSLVKVGCCKDCSILQSRLNLNTQMIFQLFFFYSFVMKFCNENIIIRNSAELFRVFII